MSLKNMLVHLDFSGHSKARLELAVGLAQRHRARLTALHVVTHPFYEPQHADSEERAARVQSDFEAAVAGAGVPCELVTVDWTVAGVHLAEVVNSHASCADLVIVGQTDPACRDRETPGDLPERVILGSGRPVLIVPYIASYTEFGNRVLVAWKPGRESARAVNDAIPLLAKADLVSIVAVNAADDAKVEGERLCVHLACHDIKARTEQATAAGISIGDVLLNRASVEGSDLLVMGAYAQLRLGAPVLGEVARHILDHMTVPVLLSH